METNTSGIPYNPAAVAITGGTITGVTGVSYDDAKWGMLFLWAGSGSMANNGAFTLTTALPYQPAEAWVLFPAGAVAAGVPASAAWLWCTFSSTTAGTTFNSTYTSGTPTRGTATAFATTGPGAFAGITAETTGPLITVLGNAMGANGEVTYQTLAFNNNSAGAKNFIVRASGGAGTILYNMTLTTQTAGAMNTGTIRNRGLTNSQVSGNAPTSVADSAGTVKTAIDTTASWTVAFNSSKGTATDHQLLEFGRVGINFTA